MAEFKGLAGTINIYTIGNIRRVYNIDTGKMEDGKALRDKYRNEGFIATKYEYAETKRYERMKSMETSYEGNGSQFTHKAYNHDIQTLIRRIEEDKQHFVEVTEKEQSKINKEIKLLTHELECLKAWGASHGYDANDPIFD